MNSNEPSSARKTAYVIIAAGLMLLLFEMLASTILIYRYRSVQVDQFYTSEPSYFSSTNLVYKIASRLGLIEKNQMAGVEFRYESEPKPFLQPDPLLGVGAAPGVYTLTFLRKLRSESDWQYLETKASINEDGSRWTGTTEHDDRPSVYIFGDSFVFGTGVNDEQTFAYLVRQARGDLNVRLFAFGGFGLTEAYLRFEHLNIEIGVDDVIILGYGDFYDKRNVKSPSWLKSVDRMRNEKVDSDIWVQDRDFRVPRAALLPDGTIEIDYIHEHCSLNDGYCERSGPSRSEMTRVSAALTNHIADNTGAKVFLLHISGDPENPIFELLSDKVIRLSALEGDFDYFIRDDVEGFDDHPGPYWHYAISRKVLEVLTD